MILPLAGSTAPPSFPLTPIFSDVKAYPRFPPSLPFETSKGGKLFAVNNQPREIIMPDEITIKPKSESSTTPATPANQAVSLNRTQLVNLCAVGLGVSFFLPWAQFLGANISGFDLQKAGDEQRLLWLIPIFCAITIFAGITKRSQQIAGQLAGVLPFCVGGYWYSKLGSDLFHILTYGAFLSLAFGVALLILPRKSK
jgi:hypothetical protein